MAHMKRKYFTSRGDCYGLVSEAVNEGVLEMMAFSWVDCNRRHLIATRESLEEGHAVSRQRCRHVVVDVNANAQVVDLDIPQPVAAEIYYATCSATDWHN